MTYDDCLVVFGEMEGVHLGIFVGVLFALQCLCVCERMCF